MIKNLEIRIMKIEYILLIIAGVVLILASNLTDIDFFEDQVSVSSTQESIASPEAGYNEALDEMFDTYHQIYQEAFSAFKQKIEKKWGEFKSSSETQWVSYTKQNNIRRSVDYETGEISVELLVDKGARLKQARHELDREVYRLLNATEAEAFEADEVAQTVEARLPAASQLIQRGFPGEKRLFSLDDLVAIVFNDSGIVKTSNNASRIYVNTDVRKAKVANSDIIRSSFTIEKLLLQKAARYVEAVRGASAKQNIPTALI
ncbi:MAG TPA: DUF3393 domain-containing protein, partial [Gammaproteobacteria bacterium]|nr:DUF3393 domain-containing protein [Gammaproteobacteria bacterium]